MLSLSIISSLFVLALQVRAVPMPGQSGWSGQPAATTAPAEPTCSNPTAADQLAEGILVNIDWQVHELAYVSALQSTILSSKSIDTSAYLATKTSLLSVQASGISVREQNQAIAPSGNAAIPGLSVVATAQAAETSLVKLLTGDPANDSPLLAELVEDVNDGTAKNAQNRVLALGGTLLEDQILI